MTEPKRIQLRRTKGWRKPKGAIVVARPTMWGNPYAVGGLVVIHADRGEDRGLTHELKGRLGITVEQAVDGFRDLMALRLALPPYDAHHADRAGRRERPGTVAVRRGERRAPGRGEQCNRRRSRARRLPRKGRLMARLPVFTVTDATTIRIDSTRFFEEYPEEHRALLDWCRAHGLVPEQMVAAGQTIVRDVAGCRVVYDAFVLNDDGHRILDPATGDTYRKRRVHGQGETPPMPFPDVILRHLNPTQETT